MKKAFLFSGQGSQYPGMGAELAERYSACRKIMECGSDIMGFDLLKKLTNSTAEELAQTKLSQPAIFSVSVMAFTAVRENGIDNDCVAGHSLGEYAAMYASGMLSVEDAFKAIKLRAEAMSKAAESSEGAMAAVIGCENAQLEELCAKADGYCSPANYNSPVQTVIAGEEKAVESVMKELAGMGKRSVRLAVSAAFHTKLMQPAADEFKAAISGMTFKAPECGFYSNLYGKKLEDFSDMPAYLAKHICSPVRFVDELNAMKEAGTEVFVELGPGHVLTGLVRKTLRGCTAVNIENNDTMEKALAALK